MIKTFISRLVIVVLLLHMSFMSSGQAPVWATYSAKQRFSSVIIGDAYRTDLSITASTTTGSDTAFVVTYNQLPAQAPSGSQIIDYVRGTLAAPSTMIGKLSIALPTANTSGSKSISNLNQSTVYTISYFVAKDNATGTLGPVVQSVASLQQKGKQMANYYYLEYLPDDYSSNSNAYPIMIFLHGAGEKADSQPTIGNLPRVLANGPPKRIHNEGKDFPFIVLSPQSKDLWNVQAINTFLEESKDRYRIDTTRIYLTGLSMGGFGTWEYSLTYPEKLAAIAPVSGGVWNEGYRDAACDLADKPIWAFHDDPDSHSLVPTSGTTRFYDSITSCSDYTGKMRMTLQENYYNGSRVAKHHAWNLAYNDNPSPTNPTLPLPPGDSRIIREFPGALPDGESVYSWLMMQRLAVPGNAEPLPGKIEAENFVSASGIRVENTTDTGLGKNIGYIDAGDFMDYNINVQTTGSYVISYRVASNAAGTGSFRLKKGNTVLHTVTIPHTGGWQNWTTIEKAVDLTAGNNILRIEAITGAWNLNWFEGRTAKVLPGKIEAESFDATSGVLVQATTDIGGGSNVGNIEGTDWLTYDVFVTTPGTYTFTYRLASKANNTGKFELKSGSTVLDTITVPYTAGWQTWVDVQQTATLSAGSQTITIQALTPGWNINWFSASSSSGARLAPMSVTAEGKATPIAVYPNPARSELKLRLPAETSSKAEVRIISLYGKSYGKESFSLHEGENDVTFNVENIPSGSYIIEIIQDKKVVSRQQLLVVK